MCVNETRKENVRASEMAQQIEGLLHKPDNLSLVPRSHKVKKAKTPELISGLHMHATAWACLHSHMVMNKHIIFNKTENTDLFRPYQCIFSNISLYLFHLQLSLNSYKILCVASIFLNNSTLPNAAHCPRG